MQKTNEKRVHKTFWVNILSFPKYDFHIESSNDIEYCLWRCWLLGMTLFSENNLQKWSEMIRRNVYENLDTVMNLIENYRCGCVVCPEVRFERLRRSDYDLSPVHGGGSQKSHGNRAD